VHVRPRRLIVPLAAALVALVALVAVNSLAGTSGAATHAKRDACHPGHLCVWAKPNAGGAKVSLSKSGVSNELANKMNNKASSAINNREGAIFLYDRRDGNGDQICMEPLSKANLSMFNFDNKASSSKLTNRNHCPV
jgi:Peptidase inhibitor family I36